MGLIKTSGGLFDFLSGKNSRAPDWMQRAGLEWAYRTYLEPRRLAGRYLMTNPHAVLLLLTRTGARTYRHGTARTVPDPMTPMVDRRAAATSRVSVRADVPPSGRAAQTAVARCPTDLRRPVSVIVVDNDAEGARRGQVVAELAGSFRFPLSCDVEPSRGHTYAYNRAFASACRATPAPDYIAVLDDDEYPEPNWLSEMIAVASDYDVDIVGGPVFPVFDDPDHWLARAAFTHRPDMPPDVCR